MASEDRSCSRVDRLMVCLWIGPCPCTTIKCVDTGPVANLRILNVPPGNRHFPRGRCLLICFEKNLYQLKRRRLSFPTLHQISFFFRAKGMAINKQQRSPRESQGRSSYLRPLCNDMIERDLGINIGKQVQCKIKIESIVSTCTSHKISLSHLDSYIHPPPLSFLIEFRRIRGIIFIDIFCLPPPLTAPLKGDR